MLLLPIFCGVLGDFAKMILINKLIKIKIKIFSLLEDLLAVTFLTNILQKTETISKKKIQKFEKNFKG